MKRIFKVGKKGFTLLEVIIVFVLLGILAVSLYPVLDDADDPGYEAVQQGTLAALRAAWPIAYANTGNENPTHAEVAAEVNGPDGVCTCDNNGINCPGVLQTGGSAVAEFGTSSNHTCSDTISSPAVIVLLDGIGD